VIIGALILAVIGSADIIRAGFRRLPMPVTGLVIGVVWATVLVLAATGLGVPAGWLAVPLVLGLGWLITTRTEPAVEAGRRSRVSRVSRARALPAVAVVVALVASAFVDPVPSGLSGFLVDALAASPAGAVAALSPTTVVLGIGAALFLVESANIVVRSALRPAMEEARLGRVVAEAADPEPAAPARRSAARWWSRRPVAESEAAPVVVEDLRGGRIIGPLERLLIVGLTLAGALPIVAGVLAAKGIVRFPEISQDGPGGSKAEYFLVGSLVSWSLAILAAGALWISAQG
jgi:hypothetical protein